MALFDILTFDHWLNPIASRHYFSRLRFQAEDARVRYLPLQNLPAVVNAGPQGGQGPVLFAVADDSYFARFAQMFVRSAAMSSPKSAVHIHVIGADVTMALPKIDQLPSHFSITREAADFSTMPGSLKGRYCQCMRFVRLAQFVKQSGRDYVAFDIDGLFQKSFADFKFDGDVGLIVRPEFADEGLRVNAGVAFMRATEAAQKFMDAASARMLQHLQHAAFTEKLDQRCLALAMDDSVKPLPSEIYTFEPGQGYFYSAKGKGKNEELFEVFKRL
jgi:hypothetical protein